MTNINLNATDIYFEDILRLIDKKTNREVFDILEKSKFKIPTPLKAVSKEQLSKIRKKELPIFILKVGKNLFFTFTRNGYISSGILGNVHKCCYNGITCERLSAAPDDKGGCQKVRDTKKRIENYEFVQLGYELVNTNNDCTIIGVCNHYVEEKRKSLPAREVARRKMAVATYALNDDKALERYERRFSRYKLTENEKEKDIKKKKKINNK